MKRTQTVFPSLVFLGGVLILAPSLPVYAQETTPPVSPTSPASGVGGVSGLSAPLSGGGAAAPGVLAAPGSMAVNVASDYRLDTDDTISIGVTRHGDVGGTYRIPPDGLIRLPRLLTPVSVRNKTCDEVTRELTDKLTSEGKLVLRPGQVSVVVTGIRTRRLFVRGNAVRGGDYDLKNGWRVADLVAIIGGTPQPDRIKARLTNPNRPTPIDIDLSTALKDPSSPANALLMEGDTFTMDAPQAKRLLIKGEGPRGIHEFDERFGLKQALLYMGYSLNGASGDLQHARLIRNAVPGDLSTEATYIPVDLLKLLRDDDASEVPFRDLDTLDIPLSENYVLVFGEVGTPRKWYLPMDRKTYLMDVFTSTGDVTGQAKVGSIKIMRTEKNGEQTSKTYDLGKYVSRNDTKENPEILPHDVIYVPTVKHPDVVGNIWTAYGLYGLLKVFVPGLK